ncbi:Gp49 family protein [Acidovorax sp. LjRoot66]|uniref:Gp49 family protein n=1 Tax=Acidovorax sp. LjRoot66 TaxID=3342334 RepID=UPI003ED00F7E
MTDKTTELEILAKGLTAPRVTPADIKDAVASAHYFVVSDAIQHPNAVHEYGEGGWRLGSTQLLTICVLQLQNGFTVTGESACASPENFDAEMGRKIARQAAEQKIWPLLGYELKTRLLQPDQIPPTNFHL